MSPEEWLKQQEPQKFNVQTPEGRGVEVDVRFPTAETTPAPAQPVAPTPGVTAMSPEQWLASQTASTKAPETTMRGLVGAATRGLAPVAAGAALGAAAGAPLAGVGAIPGAIAGAGAAALATTIGDPIVGTVNSLLGTKYTMPTQAMEDLLTRLGVAQPKTEAERIVQSTVGGAAGAGGMAQAGQAIMKAAGTAAPVTREVARQVAAQPLAQIAGGAGAGAASQVAQEMGFGPVGQVVGGLAGGMAGARAVAPRTPVQLPSDLDEAQRAGIQVLTSDVIPPRTFAQKWMQAVGERIPVAGTGPVRQTQQSQRVQAVKDIAEDFGVTDTQVTAKNIWDDLAAKRGADLTKYKTAKDEVIDKIATAQSNRVLGEEMLKEAVDLPRTLKAIDDQIAELSKLNNAQLEPAIKVLRDWKASVQNQDLRSIESLRKQLGEAFKSPELGSVRSIGEKAVSSIYRPLVDDMGDFIKANGDRRDFLKWKVSNARLADMMGDVEKTALESVLKRGDATPEVVYNMLFSRKPSEVAQLYRNLSPTGRANARSAIIARAVEKAGGIDNVSPDRFANQVRDLGRPVNIFFTGDDLKRVQGLARVLNSTKRAGEAAALPPSGVQNFYAMLGIGGAGVGGGLPGAVTTAAGMASVGGAARLYESAAVRNLLMKFPQVRPGSAEEAELLKRLMSTLAAQQQVETPIQPEDQE